MGSPLHRFVHFVATYGSLLLSILCKQTFGNVPTYYIDDYCSTTLDMNLARVYSGRLLLRRPGDTIRYLDCFMFIKAPSNKRLNFKFHAFDVPSPFGCNDDHLQIMDDVNLQISLTDKLCNKNKIPNRAYVTSGEDAAVWLKKEEYRGDQIELVFTAFTFSPCTGGEFQCDNSHCIPNDLYCNGFDNCGDESDICLLRSESIIGIIIAAVVVVVVLALIFGVYMFRRQQKIRREKEELQFMSDLASMKMSEIHNHSFNLDPDSDKKSLSDVSSMYYSNFHRNPSLLGRRDGQMRAMGYYNSRASAFGHHQHPYDSEMATKVHYIVHDNGFGSRPSTLDRKLLGGHYGPHRGESTLDRRSKSLDLRATPFYFDKDGYFSDGNVSHSQENIYATPKTKRGKKALSRHASSLKYANDPAKLREKLKKAKKGKKKKKDKGQEYYNGYFTMPDEYSSHDVTQEKNIINGQETSPSQNPLIYVTPVDALDAKHQQQSHEDSNLTKMNGTAGKHMSGHNKTNSSSALHDITAKTSTSHSMNALNVDVHNHGHATQHASHHFLHEDGIGSDLSRVSSFARHSGVDTRHPDGSPYQVHTVDTRAVEQELKVHPEHGGDVTDHVVSFRSYPCPIPKAELQLQRTNSRRSIRET